MKDMAEGTVLSQGDHRAEQLQFLRFCAFMMIFLWHAKPWGPSWFPGANAAAEAVSFFFMLSGLATGYSYWGREQGYTLAGHGKYMLGKIKKVYPLYFYSNMFLLVFTPVPTLLSAGNFTEVRPYLVQFVKNALFLQSWFQTEYFSYNGVGWFLSTIMFAYLLTPWFKVFLAKTARRKHGYTILAVLLVTVIAMTTGYCYCTREMNEEIWQYVFPPARLGEYAAGMLLGYIIRYLRKELVSRKWSKAIWSVAETAVLAYWVLALFLPVIGWQYRIVNWLLPNMLILAVFAVGGGLWSCLFRIGFFRWLGNISFECFLLHTCVLALYSAVGIGRTGFIGNAFSLAICLALTIFQASLIHGTRAGNICSLTIQKTTNFPIKNRSSGI